MTSSTNRPAFVSIPKESVLSKDPSFNGVNHRKSQIALKRNADGLAIAPLVNRGPGLHAIDRQVFHTYSKASPSKLSTSELSHEPDLTS